MTTQATSVVIYTDGACKGNHGPGGWGAWLRSGMHERELFGGEAQTANNRMELTAVIEALRALKWPCESALYTDSQYARQGISEWLQSWKRNGWRTSVKSRSLTPTSGGLSMRSPSALVPHVA